MEGATGNHHDDDDTTTERRRNVLERKKKKSCVGCWKRVRYVGCWKVCVVKGVCDLKERDGGVGFKKGNFVISTYLLGADRNLLGIGRKRDCGDCKAHIFNLQFKLTQLFTN